MTAIAAIVVRGVVYIGGDSAAIADSHYLTLAAAPKVFDLGQMVVGYTSSFRMGQALQHRLVIPDGLPAGDDLAALDRWMSVTFADAVRQTMRDCGYMKVENSRECGGQFLVGVRGQLYFLDDDFHALRQQAQFAACGSGVSACLGAFYAARQYDQLVQEPHKVVRLALEAAEACVATVRGPFHVISGGAYE